MSWLPYALAAWIFLVGLYGIVTSRNLIHLTVCVSVCQSSTYRAVAGVCGMQRHIKRLLAYSTISHAGCFLIGVALASPPFGGTFTGHALIEDAATGAGYRWVPVVLAFATIGSTGAILRVGARVFLGLGERDDPLLSDEPWESPAPASGPTSP